MANFELKKIPSIEINGHNFKLKMNEMDMLERGEALKEMAAEINKPENMNTPNLLRVCRAVEAYINDLCGKGAMKTMVGDVAMSVVDTMRLLGVVNEEASKAFSTALVEKHE